MYDIVVDSRKYKYDVILNNKLLELNFAKKPYKVASNWILSFSGEKDAFIL